MDSNSDILRYRPGNVYEYNFDSSLTVGFGTDISTDPEDTGIKLLGSVKVFAEENCGYTLHINNAKVSTTKEAIEKKIVQNIQKPVHFTLDNGKLQSQLCGDSSDSQYSLNIKRALISLFQSSIEDGTEIDVFGQCVTKTSTSKNDGALVVTKLRDLNNCAYRERTRSGLIHGIVNQAAGIKSSHLFHASYMKESKISNGIIEHVHLVEDYVFYMTEKSIHSVKGKIVTNLKVRNPDGVSATAPQTSNHSSSLIFQNPEPYRNKNLSALNTSLAELVDLLNGYVKKDSAKSFIELIRLMRNADTDTLLELASMSHENTVLTRKVYMDALFRTGTAESVKAILKQINKMDELEKMIAIISLNLVQTVDKDTLNQATILLVPNAPKQIYLSIGTLASKYCRLHGCEFGELDVISKKFVDNLKHCKSSTKRDEDRIVNVLKGIANMGNLSSRSATVLADCSLSGRATRVRVAAIQAFGSARCEPVLVEKALALLRDRNEDSEIRIEAFLAAINCPSANLAVEIENIVNSEPIYQVGGFIASSLQAIRDSTDSNREYQRYHLGNIRVTKRFPIDLKRYSYNNEVSYKLDAFGISASSDYNIIYSQQGFLPRSAKINITTELFGTTFNVFQASGRQENLEHILEYYLGPKGLLNKDFEEIIKMIDVGAVSEGDARLRRSIADDTAKFSKKYKTYGSKSLQDVSLDFSMKFFGSEMFFLSLGDEIPDSLDDIFKYFSSSFDNVKKQLSGFHKEFILHDLFLDLNAIYPTGLGIPLELNAQGFAANKVDLGIKVDIDTIIEENWLSPKYQLKLVPSVDIALKFQIGFNAYVLSTGIQLETSLHSASGGDIKLDFMNDGNGFNVQIDSPRSKLELISAAINTGLYVAELDKPTKNLLKRKENDENKVGNYHMCFNQLDSIGLNLCIDSSGIPVGKEDGHNADFSQVHPASINLYTEVESKYVIRGSYASQGQNGCQEWKIEFNTAGSKDARTSSVKFELGSDPRIYGRLALNSPIYNFAIESGFNNDDKELLLYAQYEDNGNVKRNRIGFLRSGNKYRPLIEIQDQNGVSNEIEGYSMDGAVVLQKSGDGQAEYTFENFRIFNREKGVVIINGLMEMGPAWLKNELHITIGSNPYLVKANLKIDNGVYDIGLFINDERSPDNIYGGSAHVELSEQVFLVHLIGSAAAWDVDFNNNLQYTPTESTNHLASSSFKHDLAIRKRKKVLGHLKLHGLTSGSNKLELNSELVSGKRVAAFFVKYGINRDTQGDYIVELHGKYNKHFMDIIAKSNFNGNRFVIDNTLATSWGTMFDVKGEVGQHHTAKDIYIDLHGMSQLSKKDKPTVWTVKVIGAPEEIASELKMSRDNADFFIYNGEMQHSQGKLSGGKVTISMKNLATVKGEFRVAKNGKGEAAFVIEPQTSEPKHKLDIDLKFHVQTPKYEMEAIIMLDDVKQLFISTDSYMDEIKLSTKNVAEVLNKKVALDAHISVNDDLRTGSDLHGNFVLLFPTGYVIDGNVKRKIATNAKSGNRQSSIEIQIGETLDEKKRTFLYTANTDKLNIKTKEILHNVQILFTNFDHKKLDLAANIKLLPKGQSKSIEIQSSVRGDLFNVSSNTNLIIDQYDKKQATLLLDLKFGNAYICNVSGRYNLGFHDIPAKFEIQGNAQLTSIIKAVNFNANGKLSHPNSKNGSYVFELHVEESADDSKFFYWNTILKGSKRQGVCLLDWKTRDMNSPLKLEASYQNDDENITEISTSSKQRYSLNLSYENKLLSSAADLSFIGLDKAAIKYTLNSNFESPKYVDVDIILQNIEPTTFEIKWQVKSDSAVYSSDSKIYQSKFKKGIDFHVNTPRNPIAIVGIFEIYGESKSNVLVEIQNFLDLDFLYHTEFFYKAVEDFYIKSKWNSAKLNLQNYELDIHSQVKYVDFNMKNAQGVIFTGSATYLLRKENRKSIIEGQGQVKYKDKPQKANFRLMHQIYDLDIDKEIGLSYILDGTFGHKKGVSSLKITNKDFDAKLSICEEKKQCTNVQVQSSVYSNRRDDTESPQHSLLILVDLRELGYPYEFEFQSKTIRKGWKLQYSLDSQITASNNLKYKFVANILPTNSNIELKMPKRNIFLEVKHQFPGKGTFFGHYEYSIFFYFDKANKPNEVACFKALADVTNSEFAALNVNGEIKLEHPSIRPLTVSGKLDINQYEKSISSEIVFDIFCLPEQSIIGSLSIHSISEEKGFNFTTFESLRSTGMGFNYEFSGHAALKIDPQVFSAGARLHGGASDLKAVANIYATSENSEVSVYVANEPILVLTTMFNREKYSVEVKSNLQLFGQAPIMIVGNLHPTQSRLTVKQNGLVGFNADMKVGKELKLNIQGTDKPLFNGCIVLDATNFLQTTYTSNSDNIKSFLNTVEVEIKKDTDTTVKKIKDKFNNLLEAFNKQEQSLNYSTACLANLRTIYEANANEILVELENDPVFKEMSEVYKRISSVVIEMGSDFSERAAQLNEILQRSVSQFYENLQKILKETILPAWQDFLNTCSKAFSDLRVQVVHVVTTTAQEVFNALEKYSPLLKSYVKGISQVLKPINESGLELFKIANEGIEQFFGELRGWRSKLPTFEDLWNAFNEHVKKLQLKENALALVHIILDKLHILPLTPESSEFIDKLRIYAEAKLSNTTDNEQATHELSSLFFDAMNSIWYNLDLNSSLRLPRNIFAYIFKASLSSLKVFDHLSCLLSFRFSVFNFLLNEKWENSFAENRFKSWVFIQEFNLRGHIVDGHQVLSFDGHHYSFPGSCKYILAQDSVHNNFTVIAQLNNGKLKSIALTDRDGNYAEITDSGVLKIYGNQVEYPQHENGIHAWRLFYTVWMYSEYGVQVMCTQDLKVCHVEVNGFYTSKTRGLLGNGNAEPFDDLAQVDGTIAADVVSFANGYAIGKCTSLTLKPAEAVPRSELCSDLFSLESPLISGYLFENAAPYRARCDAAVAEVSDKEKELVACTIATAYGSALKLKQIPTRLPSRCLKCPGSAGQRDLGQKFTVKIPGNKADIVFVVDLNVNPTVLNKLIAPAILEIRDSLKARGFSDVQIGVIAYNESQLYPAILTSDGGKINYHGNITTVQLNGPKTFCIHCASQEVGDSKIVEIFKDIELYLRNIIPQCDEKAFHLALNFPFRAGAAKSIVGVRSNTSEFVNLVRI